MSICDKQFPSLKFLQSKCYSHQSVSALKRIQQVERFFSIHSIFNFNRTRIKKLYILGYSGFFSQKIYSSSPNSCTNCLFSKMYNAVVLFLDYFLLDFERNCFIAFDLNNKFPFLPISQWTLTFKFFIFLVELYKFFIHYNLLIFI